MKPNMVIHCASGINNSGDEAILSVLIDRYVGHFNISVISLNKENTLRYHSHIHCYSNGDKQCKKVIKNCDIFILGGGGLLQDETTIFNIFRWTKYLKLANDFNKFTMLYANSIGPLNYRFSQKVVKSLLDRVNLITLRDNTSKELLNKIGISKNVYVTNDPVFSYKLIKDKEISSFKDIRKLYRFPEKYICVSIRHWFDTIPLIPVSICTKLNLRTHKNQQHYLQYVSNIAQIVDYCNQTLKLPIVFTSFLVDRDNKVADDIIKACHSSGNLILNDQNLSCEDMLNIISHSEFTIGMRLHSIIYAVCTETPIVALSYTEKVRAMIQKLGLENVCLDVNKFSFEQFKQLIYDNKLDSIKKSLKEIHEVAVKEEKNNDILMKHYYKMVSE